MVLSRSKSSGSSSSFGSTGTKILGGVQVSLTLLEKSVDGTSIPFVKGVAGAALEVIKIAKSIQSNREECDNLAERSTSLLIVILGSLTGKTEDAIPDHLRRGVERLTVNFHEVLAGLRIIDNRAQGWRAVMYYLDNGERLKDFSAKLQWAMEEFQVTSKVDSCLKDLERHEELSRRLDKIQESQQEVLKGQATLEEGIKKSQKEVQDGLLAIKEQSTSQAISKYVGGFSITFAPYLIPLFHP
ncbi:hypothetical protein FRC03_010632 [Tulasnella sp. 419]|nr:hypothetical protein FRC03_010632 [Tulasnella sp. 419]